MGGLIGRIAMITGVSSIKGLGFAIAGALAGEGASLVVCDLLGEKAKDCARELSGQGVKTLGLKIDVSDEDSVLACIEEARRCFGNVDILVNNAGVSSKRSIEELTLAEWKAAMDINVGGTFLCSKHLYQFMKSRGFGRIINISSISALQGGGKYVGAQYATSKAAILGFTRVLAREAAPHGITVNAVAPSLVDTDILDGLLTDEMREMSVAGIPVGRLCTQQDVANAVRFFAMPESGFVTGITMSVNGGQYIH